MRLLLDTNVLGVLCHKDAALRTWAERLLNDVGARVSGELRLVVPELSDFELRRKLLHIGSKWSLMYLDQLGASLEYLPLTTATMREAARLWAEMRSRGLPSAPPHALDGDVILAAQALGVGGAVATTNRAHLATFGVAIEDLSELTRKRSDATPAPRGQNT